ncbi:uncharacterized [Tachysurus ichikawai]
MWRRDREKDRESALHYSYKTLRSSSPAEQGSTHRFWKLWPCRFWHRLLRQAGNAVQMFTCYICLLRIHPAVLAWIAYGVPVKVSLSYSWHMRRLMA